MKYLKRITVDLPKPLKDELDRMLLRDGRKISEFIRHLIALAIREDRNRMVPTSARPAPAQ